MRRNAQKWRKQIAAKTGCNWIAQNDAEYVEVRRVSHNLSWLTAYDDKRLSISAIHLQPFSLFTPGSSKENNAKADQSATSSVVEPKETPHKGFVEDIRVTLPSEMVTAEGRNFYLHTNDQVSMKNFSKAVRAFLKAKLFVRTASLKENLTSMPLQILCAFE